MSKGPESLEHLKWQERRPEAPQGFWVYEMKCVGAVEVIVTDDHEHLMEKNVLRCAPFPDTLGSKIQAGIEAARENGAQIGQPQFGETDSEQAVLGTIIALKDSGMSYRRIADYLTAKEVPTKRGGRWQAGTVMKLYKRALREDETGA